MRRVGILVVVVAVSVGVAATALAAQSPKALLASIRAAALAQQSVHYVNRNLVGNASFTFTGDVAADRGIQHITIKVGKKSGRETIVVAGGTSYVRGDAFALYGLERLKPSQTSKYAGQWISIPSTDKLYESVAADVTLGSFIHNHLTAHGTLKALAATIKGTKVIGVRMVWGTGKKRTAAIIDARATGKPLPLEQDLIAPGQQALARVALSRWNESVSVQAPASAVPVATVRSG